METFESKQKDLTIYDFDQDGDIEICITKYLDNHTVYLSEDEVKSLIIFLQKCLKNAGE